MPYSDNMYSYPDDSDVEPVENENAAGLYDDGEGNDEDATHLSPTDGYFRASSETATSGTWDSEPYQPGQHVSSSTSAAGRAAYTPHVPDVWVQDPSLAQQGSSTAADKAREAEEERSANAASLNNPASGETPARSTTSYQAGQQRLPTRDNLALAYDSTATYNSAFPSRYTPSSRGTGPGSQYTPSTSSSGRFYHGGGAGSSRAYSERSSLLPSEAPPAYTPSATTSSEAPTSPTTARTVDSSAHTYSTFSRSSAMGRDETRGLLAAQPESMGGNPVGDEFSGGDDVETAWRERVRRRVPFVNGRNCRMVGLSLLLLLMTVGFLVSMIQGVKHEKSPSMPGTPNDRVTRPPSDNPGTTPDAPTGNYPPFDGGLDLGKSCTAAKYEYPLREFNVEYAWAKNLKIEQKIDEKDDHGTRTRFIRVSGDVVVRRTTESRGPAITLEMVSSSEDLEVVVNYLEEEQTLVITTPRAIPWNDQDPEWPCLNIRATVWVPQDGTLDRLEVSVVHLGIKLLDNLSLQIGDYTSLSTTVGPVAAAVTGFDDEKQLVRNGAPESFVFNSRFIEVKTTSARIYGSWPLYDYLVLESMSGNIKAGIEPKKVLKERPLAAKLRIKTISGNAEFWEPVDQAAQTFAQRRQQEEEGRIVTVGDAEDVLPPRDYVVEVQSTSGDMSGALAFSSSATFHSTSGKLSVDLLPLLPASLASSYKHAELETSTTSGNTAIRVLEPLWAGDDDNGNAVFVPVPLAPLPPAQPSLPTDGGDKFAPIGDRDPYDVIVPEEQEEAPSSRRAVVNAGAAAALRVLQARHTSTSANLMLRYPASWEGWFTAQSMSGSIRVSGEGVKVIRAGKDWPGVYKKVVARKGDVAEGEGSGTEVKSTSGDVTFVVGKE